MKEASPYQPSILFTVRVWQEEDDAGEVEWRGTVRRLPHGQSRPFRKWQALVTLLEAMAEEDNGEH